MDILQSEANVDSAPMSEYWSRGSAFAPEPFSLCGKAAATVVVILLVEDEANIRCMAKMYLEGQGYSVLEASDGTEALKSWEAHKGEIDLVVTDMMMPGGLNGRQLLSRLQTDRPSLKAIFVSGYTSERVADGSALTENTYFLAKPYRLSKLCDVIRESLVQQAAA
ncbi:MAG: response regulator [Chthoniobacterales bacterium]